MISYTQKTEIKWFLFGFVAGVALGYAQASGMIDILSLLPV
ncbi:MAG: hypothetical protein ABEJ62_00410 [Candidatus Nanohaloarchaea archaeon]